MIALTTIVFQTSCEDNLRSDMVDDEVYALKEGLQTIDVYNFTEAILPITVVKSGVGQRAATASLSVSPELLQAYNTANNTDYKLLEQTYYTVKKASLNFDKSTYKQAFEIQINTQQYVKLLADNPDETYIIPCQVSLQNTGADAKNTMEILAIPSIIEPLIGLNQSGLLNDANNITSKSVDITSYYLKVSVNYPTSKDVLFSLEEAADSEALVKQVNSDQGTNYKLLPKDSYDLKKNWEIKKGAKYAEVGYTVNKTKLAGSEGKPLYGDYLLPIRIVEVSENKINPNSELVLIPFKYHE